jgi:hypothetical protein
MRTSGSSMVTFTMAAWLAASLVGLTLPCAGCGDDDDDGGNPPDAAPTDADDQFDSGDPPVPDAASPDAGDENPLCAEAFVACGGNIVGDWTMKAVCGLPDQPPPACPGETVDSEFNITGTFHFGAEGDYSFETAIVYMETHVYPAACLPEGVTTCDDLEEATTVCDGDAAVSCTCTTNETEPDTVSGTYSTDGNNLTTQSGKDPAETVEYCIDGDTLRIQPPADGGLSLMLVLERASATFL